MIHSLIIRHQMILKLCRQHDEISKQTLLWNVEERIWLQHILEEQLWLFSDAAYMQAGTQRVNIVLVNL